MKVAPSRGGKATPVEQQASQLNLLFEIAENPTARAAGVSARVDADRSAPTLREAPTSKNTKSTRLSATMQEACEQLSQAFSKVESNRGVAGPDRQSVEQVREHWTYILPALTTSLLDGTYRPGDIRRVWLPESDGRGARFGDPRT